MKKMYLVNDISQTILPIEYTQNIKAVLDFYDIESNIFETTIQLWSLGVVASENPSVWCYSLYEEVLYGVDSFSAQSLLDDEDEEVVIVTLLDLVLTTSEEVSTTKYNLLSDRSSKKYTISLTVSEKNALEKINEFCGGALTWE